MQIKDMIPSKDVRNFTEDPFSQIPDSDKPLLTAWLIWQNGKLNLEEKHRAWRSLMAETEDIPIPGMKKPSTLHGLLSRYIEKQEAALRIFFRQEDDAIYTAHRHLREKNGFFHVWEASWILYDNLHACMEDAKAGAANSPGFRIDKSCANEEWEIDAYFDPEGKDLLRIETYAFEKLDLSPENDWFQSLSFPVSLPFQKGNFLRLGESWPFRPCMDPGQIFIPDRVLGTRLHGCTLRRGRLEDMWVENALELEFCPAPPAKEFPILTALSEYLKGQLPLQELLTAHHIFHMEYSLEKEKSRIRKEAFPC